MYKYVNKNTLFLNARWSKTVWRRQEAGLNYVFFLILTKCVWRRRYVGGGVHKGSTIFLNII